jgi:NAD/NADP transhydrogenase alpha subunit
MYDDTSAGVQVGEFNIRRQSESKVWIERDCGEGAEFDDALFEAAVAAFFNEHF